MMKYGVQVLGVILVVLVCARGRAGEPVTVGVLDFVGKEGVPQGKADVLADLLAEEIGRLGEVTVISKTDVRSMLGVERERYLFGAVEEARAIEIGGALGVRWVVSGSVARYGRHFVVYLRLCDVVQGRVAGRSVRRIEGEEELIEVLPEMAHDLFADVAEELGLVVTVTVAARHPQRIGRSPSAVWVITREDIQASGATTIPDLLRLVPGMEVVVVSSSYEAITARLVWTPANIFYLVLIDGREANIELMGTTLWETQPITIDDIERIEVIRGPASSLYGANAFAGVVSITTRPAPEETSVRLEFSGGEPGALLVGARTSTRLGGWGISVFGGADISGKFADPRASSRDLYRFRSVAEYRWSEYRRVLIDAGLSECSGSVPNPLGSIGGTYGLRTLRLLYESIDLRGQIYWSQFPFNGHLGAPLEYAGVRLARFAPADLDNHTVDGEFQYTLYGPTEWLLLIAGASGRATWLGSDHLLDAETFADPASPGYHRAGVSHWEGRAATFFHGEVALTDRVTLTGGLRLDYNTRTDFFASPRLAAVFQPAGDHFFRVAAGRAFRKPSFMNWGLHPQAEFPDDSPVKGTAEIEFLEFMTRVIGNRKIDNEELISLELGYVGEFLSGRLGVSADLYWNHFTNEITFDPNIVPDQQGLPDLDLSSFMFANVGPDYHIFGSELSVRFSPVHSLSLDASWTHREVFDTRAGSFSTASPRNLITLGGRFLAESGLVASLYLHSRSDFYDRDVQNPAGLLQPLLTRHMDTAVLVLARLGWRRRFGDNFDLEAGVRLFLPLSPFSAPHFHYRDEGGGVTLSGMAYGGEELCRMVTGYVKGAF